MGRKLTAVEREEVINELFNQSSSTGLWQEKDRELLMNAKLFPSRKLVGLLEQAVVVNEYVQHLAAQNEDQTNNAVKVSVEDEDTEDDEEDEEDVEMEDDDTEEEGAEPPVKNKKGTKSVKRPTTNKAVKPMSLQDWMAQAPPEVQSVVANAQKVLKEERDALINRITANKSNKLTKEALEGMSMDLLRPIAESLAPTVTANWAGAAPATNSASATQDSISQDDLLLVPTLNFSGDN